MSVQRYEWRWFESIDLSRYTSNGGTIQNALPYFCDVNLNNDADLADLTSFMEGLGMTYIGVNPDFPPNDWREVWNFAQSALTLAPATDVNFALSGAAQGSVGAGLGIDADMLPPRHGRLWRIALRSNIAVTVDVFVTINGTRTVVAAAVALAPGVAQLIVPTSRPIFQAGDVVQFGLQVVGGASATINLNSSIEMEWG